MEMRMEKVLLGLILLRLVQLDNRFQVEWCGLKLAWKRLQGEDVSLDNIWIKFPKKEIEAVPEYEFEVKKRVFRKMILLESNCVCELYA